MTPNPAALLWTLLSLVSIGYALWALYDSLGDVAALKRHGLNGARWVVARGHVRHAALRFGIFGLYFLAGVAVLFDLPAARLLVVWCLLASHGVTVLVMALERRTRKAAIHSHRASDRMLTMSGEDAVLRQCARRVGVYYRLLRYEGVPVAMAGMLASGYQELRIAELCGTEQPPEAGE